MAHPLDAQVLLRLVDGGPASPAAIADELGFGLAVVGQALNRLALAGLVTVKQRPKGRGPLYQTSELGNTIAEEARARSGEARVALPAEAAAALTAQVEHEALIRSCRGYRIAPWG